MTPALRSALAATVLMAAAGCDLEPPEPAGPLPPDKRNYVGVWEQRAGNPGGEEYRYIIARIAADGRMAYKKLTSSGSSHYCVTHNAIGIQKMKPGEIEAETIFGWDLQFSIEQPPREQNGEWTMTLDGDRLVRTRAEPEANPDKLDCDEVKIDKDEDREKKKPFPGRKSA